MSWAISEDAVDGFRGRCTIDGEGACARAAAALHHVVMPRASAPAAGPGCRKATPTPSLSITCVSRLAGVEYLLVPEQDALQGDVFATPSSPHGSMVPVARRMTVVRPSAAPLVCFGRDEAAEAAAAARKKLPPAEKKGARGAAAATPAAAGTQQQQQEQEKSAKKKDKSEKKKRKAEGDAEAAAGAGERGRGFAVQFAGSRSWTGHVWHALVD